MYKLHFASEARSWAKLEKVFMGQPKAHPQHRGSPLVSNFRSLQHIPRF